jgi:hypothetical protein
MMLQEKQRLFVDDLPTLLQMAGDDLFFVTSYGETALHSVHDSVTAEKILDKFTREFGSGDEKEKKTMTKQEFVNKQREDGATALFVACAEQKSVHLIKYVFVLPPHPIPGYLYISLQHHLTRHGEFVIHFISTLLAHGADPNITTLDGRTPLHVAAASGNKKIVSALLAHPSIDVTLKNKLGLDAAAVAGSNRAYAFLPCPDVD